MPVPDAASGLRWTGAVGSLVFARTGRVAAWLVASSNGLGRPPCHSRFDPSCRCQCQRVSVKRRPSARLGPWVRKTTAVANGRPPTVDAWHRHPLICTRADVRDPISHEWTMGEFHRADAITQAGRDSRIRRCVWGDWTWRCRAKCAYRDGMEGWTVKGSTTTDARQVPCETRRTEVDTLVCGWL